MKKRRSSLHLFRLEPSSLNSGAWDCSETGYTLNPDPPPVSAHAHSNRKMAGNSMNRQECGRRAAKPPMRKPFQEKDLTLSPVREVEGWGEGHARDEKKSPSSQPSPPSTGNIARRDLQGLAPKAVRRHDGPYLTRRHQWTANCFDNSTIVCFPIAIS